MKKLLASLLALALFAIPSRAQETKAQLNTDVSTNLPDNTTGLITPAILRTMLNSMIAAWQQTPVVNAQTGTSYAMTVSDYGKLVTFSNGSPIAVSIPPATGAFSTFNSFICNKGSGVATFNATPSQINAAPTIALNQNQCQAIISDGANYQIANSTVTLGIGVGSTNINGGVSGKVLYDNNAVLGELSASGTGSVCLTTSCTMTTPNVGTPSFAGLANAVNLPISTGVSGLGTSVATALGVNIGSSGSVTRFIAGGATALHTNAINSDACDTTTATATNVVSTDSIVVTFNGSTAAVTGYAPVTTGSLSIRPYPSAGNVNFEVCNSTLSTITPGSLTVNWFVPR